MAPLETQCGLHASGEVSMAPLILQPPVRSLRSGRERGCGEADVLRMAVAAAEGGRVDELGPASGGLGWGLRLTLAARAGHLGEEEPWPEDAERGPPM